MPKKGKKFIDKKKAISFQLVSRSQQDPLVADETAPQHVLLPVIKQKESNADREKRIEEQHKYGIYFDDDYNYLQHLKDVKDNSMEWPENADKDLEERKKAKIQLPSSVFASEVEEEVGMLNKAAPVSGPQLHLDPDVVAAMDEDFDFDDPENQLEDNFIELANGVASDQEFDDEFDHEDMFDECEEDEYVSSDFDEDIDRDSERSFSKEETRSRITRYSLTSSVLPRNEKLAILDEYFEKKVAEYDDDKIGILDLDESDAEDTPIADALIERYAEEYERDIEEMSCTELHKDNEIIEKTKFLYENMDDNTDFVTMPVEEEKHVTTCKFVPRGTKNTKTPRTYLDGPNVIQIPSNNKIRINKKTGVPIDEIDSKKLALKTLNELNQNDEDARTITGQSVISRLSQLSIRSKDESSEEKRQRKNLLREYRRERRMEKKANVLAFKEEQKRQAKLTINNRKSIQGNTIL